MKIVNYFYTPAFSNIKSHAIIFADGNYYHVYGAETDNPVVKINKPTASNAGNCKTVTGAATIDFLVKEINSRESIKDQECEMLTFKEYKNKRDELNQEMSDVSEILRSFTRNQFGLVSDETRLSLEYSAPKRRYNYLFRELQELNKKYIKIYKKELHEERQQRIIDLKKLINETPETCILVKKD